MCLQGFPLQSHQGLHVPDNKRSFTAGSCPGSEKRDSGVYRCVTSRAVSVESTGLDLHEHGQDDVRLRTLCSSLANRVCSHTSFCSSLDASTQKDTLASLHLLSSRVPRDNNPPARKPPPPKNIDTGFNSFVAKTASLLYLLSSISLQRHFNNPRQTC